MVKLIKSLLRASGTNQFSLVSSKIKSAQNQKNDEVSKTSSHNSNINNNCSNHVSTPARGWDGSSVVLVGFKHFKSAFDDPLFVTVQQEETKHDDSYKFRHAADNHNISPPSEVASPNRLNSCDSADSAVASCILAYSEEFSAFLGNSSHTRSSLTEQSPSCSSTSSDKSPTLNFSFGAPPLISEAAITTNSSFFPPPPTSEQLMDLTERFERSTNTRRFQGGSDLKRRTSSIQPFPSAFRVLLESGETRSFRYDNETTVNDILAQLQEKLNISVVQHFGFVLRRANEIVFVLPETMKISDFVDWCAANEYECSLRVVFPPKQPEDFLLVDPVAFDYLYTQCTNDVLAGRFETELGVDKAIYLSALHILQFAIASNLTGKLTTRRIDKEFGLERFIPSWVRERGRGRTIEHAVSESLRHLTERQRGAGQQNYKMQYVKLLSLMADYGAHAFPTVLLGFTEEKCSLLLGPNCGISYLPASLTQTKPVFLIRFEHIRCIGLHWSGQSPTNLTCSVHHVIKDITPIQFLLPRWLKDSFLFVIRRYRRLLVSNNGDVNVVETSGDAPSTPNSSAGSGAPDFAASSAISSLPLASGSMTSSLSPQSTTATTITAATAAIINKNSQAAEKSSKQPPVAGSGKPEKESSINNNNNDGNSTQKIPLILVNGQRSQTVRQVVRPARQALLHLNIGQPLANNSQAEEQPASSRAMRQDHLLLTESTSCPNISEMACTSSTASSTAANPSSRGEPHTELAESGIGSDMDSPRSHPPLISPPSLDGNQLETNADLLLEMRFDPPPGFGDSEDESKFVVDNPLCYDEMKTSSDDDCPPLPPRHILQPSPTSPNVSSATSRTHSIDDIVVSFNMALKGTLGGEDEESKLVWSPTDSKYNGDGSNVVTLSLCDESLPPPPPEMSETSLTLDSIGLPPSECAPPPPPPYPFPLPAFDDHNVGVSSDSGTDEIITAAVSDHVVSLMPTPVILAINNLPSDQLRATITRILLNRTQVMEIDTQLATTIADSSALRFSLSVFGTQDFSASYNCDNCNESKVEPNLALLEEISDKLTNSCRAVLTSIGQSGKTSFTNAASDAVLAFAETASFLLDSHCNNNGATSLQRISQLSSGLTHALDAFNCCIQTGQSVVEEQMLTSSETTALNEKLKRLLLNAAWLARSLAVFCSLSIQMKQDAVANAGDVLNPASVEQRNSGNKPANDNNTVASSEL